MQIQVPAFFCVIARAVVPAECLSCGVCRFAPLTSQCLSSTNASSAVRGQQKDDTHLIPSLRCGISLTGRSGGGAGVVLVGGLGWLGLDSLAPFSPAPSI